MSDLDPKAKASGSTPTVDGDAASATFWKKVIAFAINVKQGLDSLRGLNDPQDAAVTWRALAQLGLVTTNGSGKKVWKGGVIRHGNVTIGLPSGQADSTTPPIPLNFAASAAIATSILSWTEPDYSNHSYTEVWRNTSNSLTGATMIGTSNGITYADNVGVTSGVRYYWIRHISTAGIIGPYQSSSGTANTTGNIAQSDIQTLVITEALISGTISADKITTGTITADKIYGGTIGAQTITLTNSSSSVLKSSNYSAGSAGWQIRGDGAAEFQNVTVRGTINASDITGGTLSVDRIADTTLDTIKLATSAVTNYNNGTKASQSAGAGSDTNILGSGVSVSITTGDSTQKIMLIANCRATMAGATASNHTMRIRVSSVSGTVLTSNSGTTTAAGHYASLSCMTIYAPASAATYTFYLTGQSDQASTYELIELIAMVLKR